MNVKSSTAASPDKSLRMRSIRIVSISGLVICMPGCESLNFVEADSKFAPTCTQLRSVFRAAKDDFEPIRSGLEVSRRGSIYRSSESSVVLQGATSCVIRESPNSGPEYYCRWEANDNSALMGGYYRSIRDQLRSCIKQGDMSQNDSGGRTTARIEIDKDQWVTYSVVAQYQRSPYYVYFTARKF